jgi:hypothetical protein
LDFSLKSFWIIGGNCCKKSLSSVNISDPDNLGLDSCHAQRNTCLNIAAAVINEIFSSVKPYVG